MEKKHRSGSNSDSFPLLDHLLLPQHHHAIRLLASDQGVLELGDLLAEQLERIELPLANELLPVTVSGLARGVVLIVDRAGRSDSSGRSAETPSAMARKLGMAAILKTKRCPARSQRSSCLFWLKSVSPWLISESGSVVLASETRSGGIASGAGVGVVHAILAPAVGRFEPAIGVDEVVGFEDVLALEVGLVTFEYI
jgi:hypothetical protein